MRRKVLTASSLAAALGKCHYTSREHLILDKVSDKPKPYVSNPITEWGVKYEEIATRFYEHLKGVTIVEFGLIGPSSLSYLWSEPRWNLFGNVSTGSSWTYVRN